LAPPGFWPPLLLNPGDGLIGYTLFPETLGSTQCSLGICWKQ